MFHLLPYWANPSKLKSWWHNTWFWWHRLKEGNEVHLEVEPQRRLKTHHWQSNLTKRFVTSLSLSRVLSSNNFSHLLNLRRLAFTAVFVLKTSPFQVFCCSLLGNSETTLNTLIFNKRGIKTSVSWQLKQSLKITISIVIIIHNYVISGASWEIFYLSPQCN